MVKKLLIILGMLFTCSLEAAPNVEASIDGNSAGINSPLIGTLSITHEKSEMIDPDSFLIEGKRLKTEFIREVSISTNQVISFYQFQLSEKNQGLHILPSIEAKVGGRVYKTIPSTYEVKESLQSIPRISKKGNNKKKRVVNSETSSPVVFHLEAKVDGPAILYPGQRTKLFYRISFNRSIDLTRSELPFVHPKHFKWIGDVQIRDYEDDHLTRQDIVQEIEATELGVFELGPSFIEGYAYRMEGGQKKYETTLLRSEAPVFKIEVKSFPEKNQPPSFNGALGKIQVSTKHDFPSSVSVGDFLPLEIQIDGVANLEDVHLPSLDCQPGIAGFFQTPDLPPPGVIEEGKKIFHVELRPLTSWVNEIPRIEVSSFNPNTHEYVIANTKPIPLKIDAHFQTAEETPISKSFWPSQDVPHEWPTGTPNALDFKENPAIITPSQQSFISSMWILFLLPSSLALIFLQYFLRNQLCKKEKTLKLKSEGLFREALTNSSNPLKQAHLFEEAFWHKAWEKGALPKGKFNLEDLPHDDKWSSIRLFIYQLQMRQYGPEKIIEQRSMIETAKKLFKL